MYCPKVKGVEPMGVIRGKDEIPTQLFYIVESQGKEGGVIVVSAPMGKRYR